MKKLMLIVALMMPLTLNAETWLELKARGHGTYIGGLWAVVSIYCVGARYTDDSGVWASGARTTENGKCIKMLYEAVKGNAG